MQFLINEKTNPFQTKHLVLSKTSSTT